MLELAEYFFANDFLLARCLHTAYLEPTIKNISYRPLFPAYTYIEQVEAFP